MESDAGNNLEVDGELVEQCDNIRSIASKNWLNSAYVSLSQLDQIKTNVYNLGMVDGHDLKATNLNSHHNSKETQPVLSTVSYQTTAWGSNASIPDLLKQQTEKKNAQRPPSGRGKLHPSKPRPSSAVKESAANTGKERPSSAKPSISVKGAKYDPQDCPPNHAQHHSGGIGWVGPPAGMKYPDKQTEQALSYPVLHAPQTPPPAPLGTPIPDNPIPQDDDETDENDSDTDEDERILLSPVNSEDEEARLRYTERKSHLRTSPRPGALLRKPAPEPLKLDLNIPLAGDENEGTDSELDTDRLLEKAETYSTKTPTFAYTHSEVLDHTQHGYVINKEDNLPFDRGEFHKTGSSSNLAGVENVESDDGWSGDEYEVEAPKALDKISVQFKDDKNITIEITPRNQGHKVKTGFKGKKVQKPIVPVGHTNDMNTFKKDVMSLCSALKTSPAGLDSKPKSKNSETSHAGDVDTVKYGFVGGKKIAKSRRPWSAQVMGNEKEMGRILGTKRPSSASMLPRKSVRQERLVPQVVVDYGETNDECDNSKKERKTKKIKEKDLLTAVQNTAFSDTKESSHKTICDEDNHVISDEISEEDGEDVEITPDLLRPDTPTKCVSEPERNYYEVARRSAASRSQSVSNDVVLEKIKVNPVVKTTKTLEIDTKGEAKETTVKSVIDPLLLQIREKKLSVQSPMEHAKPRSRPSSAKVRSKPPSGRFVDEGRPGSRLGFVPMAPEKAEKQRAHRPTSAPINRQAHPKTQHENKKTSQSHCHTVKNTISCEENTIEVPSSPTERDMEIARLMNKHLRILKHKNNMSEPEAKDKELHEVPRLPQTYPSIDAETSHSSGEELDAEDAQPQMRSSQEKQIDNLILKHLKRPSSALVQSPRVTTDTMVSSRPSFSSAKDEVHIPSLDLKTEESTSEKKLGKRALAKPSLRSPKSTLISELKEKESNAGEDEKSAALRNYLARSKRASNPPVKSSDTPCTANGVIGDHSEGGLAPPRPEPADDININCSAYGPSSQHIGKDSSHIAPSNPWVDLVGKNEPHPPQCAKNAAGNRAGVCSCPGGHNQKALENKGVPSKENTKNFGTRCKSAPVRGASEKTRYTKPVYITSKVQDAELETEVTQECHEMRAKMAAKGVHVSAKTLQRALYPPTGQTTYYEINAYLPRSQSFGLLSHPRTWLPEEYQEMKKIEKKIAKQDELAWLKKRAEARRAKSASGGAGKGKSKGKAKKKPSGLRRSKSFG